MPTSEQVKTGSASHQPMPNIDCLISLPCLYPALTSRLCNMLVQRLDPKLDSNLCKARRFMSVFPKFSTELGFCELCDAVVLCFSTFLML